jgi:hypothetical protein
MMAKPIAAITVCPVISILQPMVKDCINYMLEKWTTNLYRVKNYDTAMAGCQIM